MTKDQIIKKRQGLDKKEGELRRRFKAGTITQKSFDKQIKVFERRRDKLVTRCENEDNHGSRTLVGGCRLCGWSGSPA